MTLQECYVALGGEYDAVLGRLRSAKMVQKFVLKFLNDPSYEALCRSLEQGDYEEAFRAAHTIKGVCQNLEFTTLYQSSDRLCESMRGGRPPASPDLFSKVQEDYAMTTGAIREFQSGLAE